MAFIRRLRLLSLAFALVTIAAGPAQAGPASDALGQCLVGQTTGDERLLMVRWLTLAFARHPAVQDAITEDASKLDDTNRSVAKLVTDLLTNRCAPQAKAAVAEGNDPSVAFQTAFQALGAAAAREVMAAPEVSAAVSGFSSYIDRDALARVLGPK